ncbi:ankyrin repeat-containing domain protein [Podospora aff. communis PSN243]|uniref:Ankyrin repeat-containing domain protein n=1 Tax=Podospora aff. communis PSN243 TaxID=3040156 RepID=A0AAV9GLC1_9PEZI|nr:ankyrin repeat-containing domain protein [Podospora aff. communis PSN243]
MQSLGPTQWATQKDNIVDLYWTKNKELSEVIKTMSEVHGFSADARQYKRYFKTWGLEKNIKADDMKVMLHILLSRRQQNRETKFTRYGIEVRPEKLHRFAKRNNIGDSFRLNGQVKTPPGVKYTTPEPEDSVRTLPAANDTSPPLTTTAVESSPVIVDDEPEEDAHTEPDVPSALPTSLSQPVWAHPIPQLPPDYNVGSLPGLQLSTPTAPGDQIRARPVQFVGPDSDAGSMMASPYPILSQTECSFQIGPPALSTPLDMNGSFLEASDHQWLYALNEPPSVSKAMRPIRHGNPKGIQPLFNSSSAATDYNTWVGGSHHHILPRAVVASPVLHPGDNNFAPHSAPHSAQPAAYEAMAPTTQEPVVATPLLALAVTSGNLDQVKLLLDTGADPNVRAVGGITPLHYAAFNRDIDLVALLMKHGASIDAVTEKGRSVLFFTVCSRERAELDPKLPDEDWRSSDVAIADSLTLQVIDRLYNLPTSWQSFSESLGRADTNGVTPLMAAAECGLLETVTIFLKRGARPGDKDRHEHTALMYAAASNRSDLVRLLLEADPRVQKRNVKHMLKLATRNLAGGLITEGLQGYQQRWFQRLWAVGRKLESAVIAEVMVPMYQELGVLDDVIELARQQGQTGIAKFLLANRAVSGG